MSILLDALKKSEEQRQLGATPGIHGPAAVSSLDMVSEHRWLPLSMMALSLMLMVWIGLQQLAAPESPFEERQLAAPAEAASNLERESVEQPADPYASLRRTPVESLPRQADGQQPSADAVSGRDQKSRLQDAVAGYQAEQPGLDTESKVAESSASASPGRTVLEPQSSGTGAAAAANAAGPHISEPISFYELPQRVRDNLQEIRITVLVYASDPDDRFLLVNGKRLQEQENLSPGVKLDEIRREGAVFVYRNYRFMVKG